jgi:hypothetical protein
MMRFHELIPDLLSPKVSPPVLNLIVRYGDELVHRGNYLKPELTTAAPQVTFPVGSHKRAWLQTLVMLDPGVFSRRCGTL